MSETVKLEFGGDSLSLCHGCLSQDRKTGPIPPGELSEMFLYLVMPQTCSSIETRKLCWECIAMLRRFSKFRNQLLQAQNLIIQMVYHMDTSISNLSNLSTTSKVDFDQYYEYIISEVPTNIYIEDIEQPIKKENIIDENIVPFTNHDIDITDDFKQENDFNETNFDSETGIEIEPNKLKTKNKSNKRKLYDKTTRNFIKHATVKIINTNWSNEKEISKYFTDEYLDENQVDDYVLKIEDFRKKWRTLKCRYCNKQFSMKSDYLRHMNLNHQEPDASNNCLLCKKKFPTLEKLKVHWKHTHSCYSRCNMCNMYCKKIAQKKHLNYYHTKVYRCDECGEQLISPQLFNIHYKAKHATFICDVCNRTFHLRRTLVKHIEAAHTNEYKCKICQKTFSSHRNYITHIKRHQELSVQEDKELSYCVECDRQFPSIQQYKHHLRNSTRHKRVPVKSIPCPECGKIFRRTSYMRNHLYVTHMKEKAKHFCELCDKYFTNGWGLKVHYKNVHLKVPKPRNHICDLCGRGFTSKPTLVHHRRTHTGERPHSCQYCNAAFAQKVALQSHQKTHHREALDAMLNKEIGRS